MRGCFVVARCTVKKYNSEKNGIVLSKTAWCGNELGSHAWAFSDAQHLALSVQGSVEPCRDCVKAIIKELEKELD